ncbi:MAG TPA: hypothetical protein VG826_00730 [Pirellulales bacterium]|nr:hypothetical protein [Pirellulales bacterium]
MLRGVGWQMLAVGCLVLPGCAKRPSVDHLPTFVASGRVFYGGKAAEGAEVQLWAVGGDPALNLKLAGACPHATVEADGSFRLTTYSTGDGAPAGDFALTIRWPLPPPPGREVGQDRFGGRYADPARPLRQVRISAADNVLEAIRLD